MGLRWQACMAASLRLALVVVIFASSTQAGNVGGPIPEWSKLGEAATKAYEVAQWTKNPVPVHDPKFLDLSMSWKGYGAAGPLKEPEDLEKIGRAHV